MVRLAKKASCRSPAREQIPGARDTITAERASGALAAQAGVSTPAQLVIAAVIGGGAVLAWHFVRRRRFTTGTGTNLDFDAGEHVHVDAWTADNTASVRYRGTVWTAVPVGGTPQGSGPHRVRHVDGSRLVLEKI